MGGSCLRTEVTVFHRSQALTPALPLLPSFYFMDGLLSWTLLLLALQEARERQSTATLKEEDARRAGIEGTIAQGIHSFDLR